ncbi:MAG: putative toxin-antitoxin system toxin component, PIN family [Xenococcus sp. MO_188.B8]|nr:putative toxin-antitoxin system toxin component, PIN family [Xenococcus sp. MO_188.B8]
MKVIVDTNILVSAVLRGRTPKEVIQFIIDTPDCDWLVSKEILEEYKQVLSRPKFKLTPEIINQWWFVLDTVTRVVEVTNVVDFPRDRKDAKFLACALATDADFLLTGDKDFEEAKNLGKTRIISVSLFKRLLIELNSKDY